MTSNSAETDPQIWLALADLFFLDDGHDDAEFDQVAGLLRDHGWSSERTERFLVEYIAPVFAANLWVVAGAWGTFGEECVKERVGKAIRKRARLPRWWLEFRDWRYRRMIRELDWEKLRVRLAG